MDKNHISNFFKNLLMGLMSICLNITPILCIFVSIMGFIGIVKLSGYSACLVLIASILLGIIGIGLIVLIGYIMNSNSKGNKNE